jgi:hypothetical protein
MKSKLIITTLTFCILLSCKKKTEDVIIPSPPADPIAGNWYMHLIDAEGNYGGGSHYAYRAGGVNASNRGNISFTTNLASKSLYSFTKVSEGKYSISAPAYAGQYLAYVTNNTVPYETRMFFSLNPFNGSDDFLFTFEKVSGTTDTYIIKSVSNPTTALSASITNSTSLRPNFVVAGASFTYQKWKLEK